MAAWSLMLGVSSCSLVLDWSGYTGGTERGDANDANSPVDASDASSTIDAPDLDAPEADSMQATPLCGPLSCGGCCNENGFCAGGASLLTCGMGGEACQNCMSKGQSCNQGACSSSDSGSNDSGPPPVCNVSQCNRVNGTGALCIQGYQDPCCRSDGTCGCQVQIPTLGPCM
jgi:hypothetical protein